ncbi:Gag-Pol polyprotein, partial [Mucuna pruriens]
MKCPSNLSCSVKSLTFRVLISWGHYVSRWVEVIATKTNDAKVVVDFLKSNIFYRFGVPKALISDQGNHFCNRVMFALLHKYGVNIFGKVCHLPVEIEHHAYWVVKQCNLAYDQAGKQRMFQLQELDELRFEAYENSQIYKQKVKQFHDQQILRKEFQVGRVLLFNSCLKLIVVELKDKNTNSTFQVNGHQIKLFHDGPASIVGETETISLMEPTLPDGTSPIRWNQPYWMTHPQKAPGPPLYSCHALRAMHHSTYYKPKLENHDQPQP